MHNILFVDDDRNFLHSIKRLLHSHRDQWEMSFAETVDQALELMARDSFDLVICDLLMPGKTGLDLLKSLMEPPDFGKVSVIILTGMAVTSDIKLEALRLGATDLLNKPVDKAELMARITSCLKLKAYHDDIVRQKSSLEHKVEERARYLSLGAEVGSALVRENDLQTLLQLCTESIVKQLKCAFARIWVMDEEKERLELRASAGLYTHINGGHQFIALGQYKIGVIASNKKPHLTNQVIGDPQISDQEWAIRKGMVAFAGHPLIVGEKVVGVMAMFSREKLSHSALEALGAVADAIALGIERKHSEDRARFYAFYDPLTRLPNREFFNGFLRRMVDYATRYGKRFSVVIIDLDDFNRINESLGHAAGDQCLKTIARRLSRIFRSSDCLARLPGEQPAIVRLGGDEFVVLLQETPEVYQISHVIQRVLREMAGAIRLAEYEVFISISMGISVFPEDGKNLADLFKHAETALYHAKNMGKNRFAFYSQSMHSSSVALLELETELRRAVHDQALEVYYQPKATIPDRELIGAEALIRWRNQKGEFVPPSRFIPLAETCGLIIPIGDWVLDVVCRQNRIWQNAGMKKIPVAVNVSGRQFEQKNFVEKVRNTLERSGLDSEYLELEITETVLMSDPQTAIVNLEELKALGVHIALDDFGTGYSSLAYLQQLCIDQLKIDISFIRNLLTNPNDAVMVKTIISMAHNLGLKVIAEGVETSGQLDFLADLGCDVMQGYLFGRPVPSYEFEALFFSWCGFCSMHGEDP